MKKFQIIDKLCKNKNNVLNKYSLLIKRLVIVFINISKFLNFPSYIQSVNADG